MYFLSPPSHRERLRLALNGNKVVLVQALASMPGPGLLSLDPWAPLRKVSGSASSSEAVSLPVELGFTLLPAVLLGEDTTGSTAPLSSTRTVPYSSVNSTE